MIARTLTLSAFLIGAATMPPAWAQAEGVGQPSATGRAPAADTQDPGKTATEAVTNPAAVPPSEGSTGSAKPSGASEGSASSGPGR